jgi:DNA-binding response OmpR family regulator
VLVVESDRLIKALIVEWLQLAGDEAVCVTDLAGATALASRLPDPSTARSADQRADQTEDDGCDLVLADVPAPHRAARQMVSQLGEVLPGRPIIAMSADITAGGHQAREALARELGATAVLVKPFSQSALLAAIRRARP